MKYSGKIDSLKILLFHDLSDTYYHIEQRVKYRFQLSSFDLTLRWIDARCTYMLCNVTLLSSFSGNCFLLKMHLAAFLCSYGYLSPKDLWIVKLTNIADLVKRLEEVLVKLGDSYNTVGLDASQISPQRPAPSRTYKTKNDTQPPVERKRVVEIPRL